MPLTGRPRFGGVLTPYMAMEAWCDCAWQDESVWLDGRHGHRRLREARYRLAGSGAWTGLSFADLKQLHGLLSAGVVEVTPRTRAAGDPPAAELLVPCRITSGLQETTPIWRRDAATGTPLYRLEVVFEGVATVDRIPGALYGGLVLLGETDEAAEVEPWGIAALVESTLDVEFDGTVYTLETATLTPAEIAALVLAEDPADLSVLLLDAINDFQAPPASS